MKNQILYVCHKALLQYVKGINFNWPILKNAKPKSLYNGFVVFKPKSRYVKNHNLHLFGLNAMFLDSNRPIKFLLL
jgi:hypothetical protein